MAGQIDKGGPTGAQRTLLEICARINFGRTQNLHVRDGQPAFNPAPTIHREVKFGGDNGSRPDRLQGDRAPRAQAAELLAELRKLDSGVVELIEVKHGLPFRMILPEAR